MFLTPTSYDYDFFIKNPRILNFCFGFIIIIVLAVNKNYYFLTFVLGLFVVDFIFLSKNNDTDFFFIKYKMFSHIFLVLMVGGIALSFAWSLGVLYFIFNFLLLLLFSLMIGFNAQKNFKNNMRVVSDKYYLAINGEGIDLYEWVLSLNVKKANKFYFVFAVLFEVVLGFVISGSLGSNYSLHEFLLLVLCYFLTILLIYIFPYNYLLPYLFLSSKNE